MKIGGREEFLGSVRYCDVECPDAGTVSVFDYISHGALCEFAHHRSTPDAALPAVIRSSIANSDASFSTLTSNDHAAIARHLVQVAGVEGRFEVELKNSDVAAAFVHAIEESDGWQDYLESEKKMLRYLEHSMRPFNSVLRDIERHKFLISDLNKHVEMLRQFERTAITQTALVQLDSFRSIALEATKTFGNLGRIHQDAVENLQRWNRLVEPLATQATLAATVITRQTDLTRTVERLNQIKPLVAPIVDLSSSFADVAAQLRAASSLPDDLLIRANHGLAESRLLTLKTSDFFARERSFEFAPIQPALPREATEQEEEIEAAYEEGETILHEKTALIIAEGTSLTECLRQAVGDEVDQRLGKFGELLARLERLSKPTVFLDLVREFAVVAARDYWGTLWADPGNKWQSRPERHAQAMLGMFMHGKWSGVAFVGREIANGDGFVDLLVNFMARDYIIELKMIGAGWPVSHAESGLAQLEQYMANYQSQEAYLVVFDGRKTSRGRQLPETRDTEYGTIHIVVVPAYFDPPSSH